MNVQTSIIIPCYNAEKYIEETIQSVINQTYQDWELIIIDDGSKDSSRQIISTYLDDKRISYQYQENSGVSIARNNGITKANGKYITFLDADDVWFSNNLEEKIRYIENQKVDAVYSLFDTIHGKKDFVTKIVTVANQPTLKDILLQKGNYSTAPSGIVLKSEILQKIGGFDAHLSNNADQDIWIRILSNNYKIALLEKPLWQYRVHERNMSSNITLLEKDSILLFNKMAKNNLFHSFWFKQRCVAKLYLMLAGSWWKDGNNKWRGFYFILSSLANYPPEILTLFKKMFSAK